MEQVVRHSKACQKLIDTAMVDVAKSFDGLASNPDTDPEAVDQKLQQLQETLDTLEQQVCHKRPAVLQVYVKFT